MNCPNCIAVDLLMSERQGIEIDYCPKCRGIWLDRGELDKFVQHAERRAQSNENDAGHSETGTQRSVSPFSNSPEYEANKQQARHRSDMDDDGDRRYPQHGRKKESFWGNLFDFD
jgi:Zn-finger nucleic acid-binding protein